MSYARPHHPAMRGVIALTAMIGITATASLLTGCSSWWQRNFASRELVTESVGDSAASLNFRFPYAWYENEAAQTSLYLSDIPPEQLVAGGELTGQVVHLQDRKSVV